MHMYTLIYIYFIGICIYICVHTYMPVYVCMCILALFIKV